MMEKNHNDTYSSMPRGLKYRGHIRCLFPAAGILLFYYLYDFVVKPLITHGAGADLLELGINAVLFGLMGCIWWLVLRPFTRTEVHSFANKIEIKRGKKINVIPFEQIVGVSFKSFGMVGGWYTLIMSDGERYRFFTFIERPEYPIENLHKARPDIMGTENYMKLCSSLISADHSWAQLYWIVKEKWFWIYFSSNWLLLPVMSSLALWDKQKHLLEEESWSYWVWNSVILAAPVMIGLALLCLLLVFWEYMGNRRFNKTGSKRRDMQFESRTLMYTAMASIISGVFVVSVIYRYDLNAYRIVQLESYAPNPEMQETRFVFYLPKSFCMNNPVYTSRKQFAILVNNQQVDSLEVKTINSAAGLAALKESRLPASITEKNQALEQMKGCVVAEF